MSDQNKHSWTPEDDELLKALVEKFGNKWSLMANSFPNRSPSQLATRWSKTVNPKLVKGPFSHEEDEKIVDHVLKYGPKKWSLLAKDMPARSPKQCRERYMNCLNPSICKKPWADYEDQIIVDMVSKYGKKWALISRMLPGRSDNSIKNRWNSSLSRKIQSSHNSSPNLMISNKCENKGSPVIPPSPPKLPPIESLNQFIPMFFIHETNIPNIIEVK